MIGLCVLYAAEGSRLRGLGVAYALIHFDASMDTSKPILSDADTEAMARILQLAEAEIEAADDPHALTGGAWVALLDLMPEGSEDDQIRAYTSARGMLWVLVQRFGRTRFPSLLARFARPLAKAAVKLDLETHGRSN